MFDELSGAEILVAFKGGLKVLPLFRCTKTNRVYAKNGTYYLAVLSNGIMSSNKTYRRFESAGHELQFEAGYLVCLDHVK